MLLIVIALLFEVLTDDEVRIDNTLLGHREQLIIGLTLLLNLIAISKSLLAVELILLDQIGPSLLTALISCLVFSNFLSKIDELSALLLQHLFTVGAVGIGAEVGFTFDLPLHKHLLKTRDLCFLVNDFGW